MVCHCSWKMCAVLIGLSREHLPDRSLNDLKELQLNLVNSTTLRIDRYFTIGTIINRNILIGCGCIEHCQPASPLSSWLVARVSYFQSLSRIPLSAVLTIRHPSREIYCFILCINFLTLASFAISKPISRFNLKILQLHFSHDVCWWLLGMVRVVSCRHQTWNNYCDRKYTVYDTNCHSNAIGVTKKNTHSRVCKHKYLWGLKVVSVTSAVGAKLPRQSCHANTCCVFGSAYFPRICL